MTVAVQIAALTGGSPAAPVRRTKAAERREITGEEQLAIIPGECAHGAIGTAAYGMPRRAVPGGKKVRIDSACISKVAACQKLAVVRAKAEHVMIHTAAQ